MKQPTSLKIILICLALFVVNYSCKNDDDSTDENDDTEGEIDDITITTDDCDDIIELSNFTFYNIEENDDDEIDVLFFAFDLTNLTPETLSIGNFAVIAYISTDDVLDDDDERLNFVNLVIDNLLTGETEQTGWSARNLADYADDLDDLFLFIEVDFENIPCTTQIGYNLENLDTLEL